MKNIIVAGANGFIGNKLISKLLIGGGKIIALDVNFANTHLPENERIIKIECNGISPEELVKRIPQLEYDAFYNLAWRGVNGPDKSNAAVQLDNIKLSIQYADLAKALACKRYLCAGTIAEQSVNSLAKLDKTSGGMLYGVAKHCAKLFLESYCKNIGLPFVWMQFSNIYGEGNKTGNLISYTLNEILSDKEATFGPAEQPYDFIYVDDLIAAIVKLGFCEKVKTFYYIGSGSPKYLKDYLREIGKICHKEEKICIGVRPDDGIRYDFQMFDNSPLVMDIGNYITVTFEEGVRRTAIWLNNQS